MTIHEVNFVAFTLLFLVVCPGQIAAISTASEAVSVGQPVIRRGLLDTSDDSNDVYCGSNAYCPSATPICCGDFYGGPPEYCIPAGYKCCGRYTQCSLDSMCCGIESDNPTCCPAASSCNTTSDTCKHDDCASNADAGSCLASASVSDCGWCCEEHRCTSLSFLVSGACPVSQNPPITEYFQTCEDPCSYASTCAVCQESDFNATMKCSWCCQSQSCMSQLSAEALCSAMETITDSPNNCPACLGGGGGLHPQSQKPAMEFTVAFLVIGCGAIILCVASISRMMFQRARRETADMMGAGAANVGNSDATGASNAVRSAIRRYGFDATVDVEPEPPVGNDDRNSRGEKHITRHRTDFSNCVICRVPLQNAMLRSSEQRHESEVPDVERVVDEKREEQDLPENRQEGPHEEDGEGVLDGATKIDTFVVLLPCLHALCYSCLDVDDVGLEQQPPRPATPPTPDSHRSLNSPQLQAPNSNKPSPDDKPKKKRARRPPTLESRIIKSCRGKCIVCQTEIQDIFVPSKAIR